MEGTAMEKVPGGKLVRARVNYDQKIKIVKITGDFFLHPEEAIVKIEECMAGFDKNVDQGYLAEKIREVVRSEGVQLIGVTEDAIARVVKGAMGK